MGGGMRGRRLAALKSANESREPKFVIAARELVRAAPSLRPQYSRNPLCAPCDGAEFSASVGARWAADARALCDWDAMPPALDVAHPEGGAVPADRGARKRQQLLNVALFVAPALRLNPRARVVDFGAGGGHQTLILARAFPEATFALVDLKRRSLDVAERRVQRAGLANVRVVHGRIEDFREDFDVGVALHACGNATDHSIARCVRANAAFLVSPCCIGKLKFSIAGGSSFSANVVDYKDTALGSRPEREAGAGAAATKASEDARNDDVVVCPPVEAITHPRSRWLSTQLASENEFAALAAAADTGHAAGVPGGDAPSDDVLDIGRAAKTQVELDRAEGAREAGYVVRTLAVLNAAEAPPNKSDLIVGARRGRWRDAFERLAVAVSA